MEELKTVQADIADLEKRLDTLKMKEFAIKSKLALPLDLKGKYLKYKNRAYTYYLRIDEVVHSKTMGMVDLKGPAIDIYKEGTTINFNLFSHHSASIDIGEKVETVSEKEWNNMFEEAIKYFK